MSSRVAANASPKPDEAAAGGRRLRRWRNALIAVLVLGVVSQLCFGMPLPLALRVLIDDVGAGEYHDGVLRGRRHGLPVYLLMPGGMEDGRNDLYNVLGLRICSPSGGLDGAGDGTCPDPYDPGTQPVQIWPRPSKQAAR